MIHFSIVQRFGQAPNHAWKGGVFVGCLRDVPGKDVTHMHIPRTGDGFTAHHARLDF